MVEGREWGSRRKAQILAMWGFVTPQTSPIQEARRVETCDLFSVALKLSVVGEPCGHAAFEPAHSAILEWDAMSVQIEALFTATPGLLQRPRSLRPTPTKPRSAQTQALGPCPLRGSAGPICSITSMRAGRSPPRCLSVAQGWTRSGSGNLLSGSEGAPNCARHCQ